MEAFFPPIAQKDPFIEEDCDCPPETDLSFGLLEAFLAAETAPPGASFVEARVSFVEGSGTATTDLSLGLLLVLVASD